MLVAFIACGDSERSTDERGAGADFCAQAEQFLDLDFGADEASVLIGQIDPPDEISDDWATWLEGYETLANLDRSDPEAIPELPEEFVRAGDVVGDYLQTECGF